MGDLLNPPACRAQGEDVAYSSLVDHLFIKLADATTGLVSTGSIAFTDEENTEEAAIGNRAAGGDGKPLGSGTGYQDTGVAMPVQPRPQLGELLAGIPPAQHVQHRFKGAVRKVPEAVRAAHQGVQLLHLGVIHRD